MAHEKMIKRLESLIKEFNSEDFSIDCMEREFRGYVLLANLYADNNNPFTSRRYIGKAEDLFYSYLRPDMRHAHKLGLELDVKDDEMYDFCNITIERFKRRYWEYMMTAAKVIELRKDYMLGEQDLHKLN